MLARLDAVRDVPARGVPGGQWPHIVARRVRVRRRLDEVPFADLYGLSVLRDETFL